MKTKEIKMIKQCPDCLTVDSIYPDGIVRSQKSIVLFDHLPKERCITCKKLSTPKPR